MVSNVVLHSGYQLLSVFTFLKNYPILYCTVLYCTVLIQWFQAFKSLHKNLRCKFYFKISFYTNMLLLQKEKNFTLVQNIDQNEFSKQKSKNDFLIILRNRFGQYL